MSNDFNMQIVRTYVAANSILGELYLNGNLLAMSLELPWRDNASGNSSIPEGEYKATLRYDKPRDNNFTIQLEGTGPRTGIQIHVGNKPADSTGCILLGLKAKFAEELIGDSAKALIALKNDFYGSKEPISCPDLKIRVKISGIRKAMRFYPSPSDTSFFWTFEGGYWNSNGGNRPAKYKEVLRDCSWIISKAEDPDSSFSKRYIRWGIAGGTPFQISKDLIGWTTLVAEDLMVREPPTPAGVWSYLSLRGGGVKTLLEARPISQKQRLEMRGLSDVDNEDPNAGEAPPAVPQISASYDQREGYNRDRDDGDGDGEQPVYDEDDGERDGVIHIEYDDNEVGTISIDDPDTQSDYSDEEGGDFEGPED